jgi:hypothetical protein
MLGESYYQPTTFSINYRYDYIQEDGLPTQKAMPVFCHEYLHYIQDVASVYGVKRYIDFFDAIVEIALYMKKNRVFIPYKKHCDYKTSYLKFSTDMNEFIYSKIDWDDSELWMFDGFKEIQYKILYYKEKKFNIPRVEINLINHVSGNIISHAIGVSEIKEAFSMAIEYHCLGEKDDICTKIQNRYCIVERILSKIFYAPSNMLVAIVCFWSLQSVHPGVEFKKIYEFLSDKSRLEEKDINNLLRERFWNENEKDFGQLKCSLNDMLEDQERNEVLSKVLKWYDGNVLCKLENIINSDFILNLFSIQDGNEVFTFLQKNIPVFLYEQGDAFAWTMSEKDDGPQNAFLSKALNDLIFHIHEGKTSEWACPFKESCRQEQNSYCEKEPWRYEKQCPYVAAARLLNIAKNQHFKVLEK